MNLKKCLANPLGYLIKNILQEPKPGDKVSITDWTDFSKPEIAILCKKDYLTVLDAFPIMVGSDGNYHWEYTIVTEEAQHVDVLFNRYKLI